MTIFIVVILYEILSIGGVSLFLVMKGKKKAEAASDDAFVTSNRDLPTVIVGISLALAVLGAVHVFGIMEMSFGMGAVAIWFSIAHVTLLCVVCLCTGRWVRRIRASTVPDLLEKLMGKRLALVCTCVIAGQTFAILTMEVQALGIIFNTLTFNKVPIQLGAVIGGAFGIFYVVVAGMKEIGWVNLINTIVMYVGLAVAALFLGGAIPGGWEGVQNHFASADQAFMTNIFGTPAIFLSFGVVNIIAVTFAQGISQMGLQSAMAAKNEKSIVKALWIAAPVNGIFGVFTMSMGIAAKALVESGQLQVADPALAAKTAGATMLVNYLPTWLVAWLLAAFLGAVLSTFAITTMGMGALFSKNIYMLKYPNATAAQRTRITRLIIVVSGVVAMAVSSFLPEIVNGANWAFAWLCPVFWNVIYGLFWKRSTKAAGIVLAVSWLLVLLWTYTPLPFAIGLSGVPVPFVTLAVSIVLGLILYGALPGRPGYFKEQKA
jgi:SSS family solute:Na+ symporter